MRSASAFLLAALLAAPALAQENPVTEGIALWLRADAGVTLDASDRVESWQDQSDDTFTFTHVDGVAEDQRPLLVQDVLNGQEVVRFDGVNDFLTGGDILDDVFVGEDQRFTLFTVINATAGDNDVLLGKTADSGFNPNEDQRQLSYSLFGGEASMATYFALGPCCSPPVRRVVSENSIVDEALVLTFEYDGSQSDEDGLSRFGIRSNGEPETVSLPISIGPLGSIQNGAAPLAVGARVNTAGTVANLNFQGDIAELILYDRLLSDEELQQVEVYLGEKYGLAVVGVAVEDGTGLPESHSLSSIYPNPFHLQATVRLKVGQAQQVRVAVHDVLGREVSLLHEGVLSASEHTFTLSSEGLSDGVYFVRVVGERFTDTRRAVVFK